MKLFRDETGITEIPKGPADKYYTDFLDFNRKLFRDHVENYTKALHDYDPDFEITSNWAFSSTMPEPVTIDLDYLSGDVTPQEGVNRAAFESRMPGHAGKTMGSDAMELLLERKFRYAQEYQISPPVRAGNSTDHFHGGRRTGLLQTK